MEYSSPELAAAFDAIELRLNVRFSGKDSKSAQRTWCSIVDYWPDCEFKTPRDLAATMSEYFRHIGDCCYLEFSAELPARSERSNFEVSAVEAQYGL